MKTDTWRAVETRAAEDRTDSRQLAQPHVSWNKRMKDRMTHSPQPRGLASGDLGLERGGAAFPECR